MDITLDLTDEQRRWLAAQVAAGKFPSMEAAAQHAIAERMAQDGGALENDDLSWAKPLVDEAVGQFEQGLFVSLDEHSARTTARLAALGVKWR